MSPRLRRNCRWGVRQMIKEVLKRSLIGIAFGGIATFIALTTMKFSHIEGTVSEIWNHMLASFCLGIYFGVASLIFETEKWSALKQTLVHYTISTILWLIIALQLGWLPYNLLSVALGILTFTFIYIIYWTGFYLYFKKMEESMNKQLQKK